MQRIRAPCHDRARQPPADYSGHHAASFAVVPPLVRDDNDTGPVNVRDESGRSRSAMLRAF